MCPGPQGPAGATLPGTLSLHPHWVLARGPGQGKQKFLREAKLLFSFRSPGSTKSNSCRAPTPGKRGSAGGSRKGAGAGRGLTPCPALCAAGSAFRDEFDLAILQLQENNRLEILKRKWWEGGKCPKEEDHRARGKGHPGGHGLFLCIRPAIGFRGVWTAGLGRSQGWAGAGLGLAGSFLSVLA